MRVIAFASIVILGFCVSLSAQTVPKEWPLITPLQKPTPTPAPTVTPTPTPAPVSTNATASTETKAKSEKPRIYVTESQSWETKGKIVGNKRGIFGSLAGGARPQTAEIIKNFNEKCECIVTMKEENADYVVMVEHEGGKALALKDNKYAVFKANGDAIKSGSTRSLGSAVKDACAALIADWSK